MTRKWGYLFRTESTIGNKLKTVIRLKRWWRYLFTSI